jgi:zinc D-Ala-D-Ala carboxypeptidase
MLKYFKEEEFACRCGCGLNNFDPVTAQRLDYARGLARVPFRLNSACRCKQHNEDEGGKENSSHLGEDKPATAVDISAPNSYIRFRIIKGLVLAGFQRIGVTYDDFVHADLDPHKDQEVAW